MPKVFHRRSTNLRVLHVWGIRNESRNVDKETVVKTAFTSKRQEGSANTVFLWEFNARVDVQKADMLQESRPRRFVRES